MHPSFLVFLASCLFLASTQFSAATAEKRVASREARQQVDESVSFDDGSASYTGARYETVTLADDQYALTTITATVFATGQNTSSSYNTTVTVSDGASNVTATLISDKPHQSECVCLRKRETQDDDQDEPCSQCFPDRGYGNLPNWSDESLVQPSITKAVEDAEDAPMTITADPASSTEGPKWTPMLPQTNATIIYTNGSSTTSTRVGRDKPKSTRLTSTEYWSSDVGNSTITSSSTPTNDAAADDADASSSGYNVTPKSKHSLAFWVGMWAVLVLHIEGGFTGLW